MTPWMAFVIGLFVATVVVSLVWYISWYPTKERADEAERRLTAILFEWRQLQTIRATVAARVEDPDTDTHLNRELTKWAFHEGRLRMIMQGMAAIEDARIHIERK